MYAQDFYNVCEIVKQAADMAVPVEQKPAPEAGSQPVAGMTNNMTFNPASVGSSVYASPADAIALAKAKEQAALAVAKQASYLNDLCEQVKQAADMAVPVEQKPAPEAGSQPVAGMTNNMTFNPASVGSSVYASPADAIALAKAKEQAALALAKQASEIYEKVAADAAADREYGVGTTYGNIASGLVGGAGVGAALGALAGRSKGSAALGALAGSFLGGTGSKVREGYKNYKYVNPNSTLGALQAGLSKDIYSYAAAAGNKYQGK